MCCCLLLTGEAAVQNLKLTSLNNSEAKATWDVNPNLFELYNFAITYFIKLEQQQISMVTVNDKSYAGEKFRGLLDFIIM